MAEYHSQNSKSVGGQVVTSSDHNAILHHVFPESMDDTAAISPLISEVSFGHLNDYLDRVLSEAEVRSRLRSEALMAEAHTGRLGLSVVHVDMETNVGGQVLVESNRLGITGHSNFSTIRANTCVFRGRWLYEVHLASKGVMQLGWCTKSCIFSHEKGVGDTPDSYAYDGARTRKWNVNSTKYGEAWLSDDVITCAIDCDEGHISWYRNGQLMGLAFDNIRLGAGIAYFPAISLSHGEIVTLNFGATPLMYPIEGYRPLQLPPVHLMGHADVLFGYWERLLPMTVDAAKNQETSSNEICGHFVISSSQRSLHASCWLIAGQIMEKLEPLLKDQYIFEYYMIPFLLKFCDTALLQTDQSHVHTALQMIWAFFQSESVQTSMTYLVVAILTAYRYSPVIEHFRHQQVYLHLMLAIIKHRLTKNYLLRNVIFDQVRFPIIFHPKPPGHQRLCELVPTVWWNFVMTDEGLEEVPIDTLEKDAFYESVRKVRQDVEHLEAIQVEILKSLLADDDICREDGMTSRTVFCKKFREFLQENFEQLRNDSNQDCPLPVILCFFHRLVKVLRYYWELPTNMERDLPLFNDLFLPIEIFCLDKVNFFDIQRLGGLSSFLKKTYKDEITAIVKHHGTRKHDKKGFFSLKKMTEDTREKRGRRVFRERVADEYLKCDRSSGDMDAPSTSSTAGEKIPSHMPSLTSLLELVDGIVILYHLGAHKQLTMFSSIRENTNEYLTALRDTENKLLKCPENRQEIRDTLLQTKETFIVKLTELSRYMAWIMAVVYSEDKRQDVFWLFRVLLFTFTEAKREENLFTFLPDFYVDTCISCYQAIKGLFHPTLPMTSVPGCQETLVQFSSFLVRNFSETRIANADIRDSLLQCLANFVCYPTTLAALESMPPDDCEHFIRCLLAPYEGRSWAQTNWILARFWKGCGFAFRYTHLPHVTITKNNRTDSSGNTSEKPCPSSWYQSRIQMFLSQESEASIKFVDTVLTRLNWAFSEVVGNMQELQQTVVSRLDRLQDVRHVKMCSTCFDITVGLLRVLEMTVRLLPDLFLDWTRPQAELFCSRLYSSLCQILNRITAKKSLFESVTSAQHVGLENVDRFPILTAVAGILVEMIVRGNTSNRRIASRALLTEPSFQLISLHYFLGGELEATPAKGALASSTTSKKLFSLRNYKDVSETEVVEFTRMVTFLQEEEKNADLQNELCSEDDLCTICFAHAKAAVFKPCGHQSCKSCITYQMMTKPECFFCKAAIKRVEDFSGKEIRLK